MKWGKLILVIIGAVLVTALGIDAADTLSGSRNTMLGQLIATTEGGCPTGMVSVPTASTFTCVDQYEASPGVNCQTADPQNEFETQANLDSSSCSARSAPEVMPWRYIAREQAQVVCARAGKRLPTAAEWYEFAIGSPDTTGVCNIDSERPRSGSESSACSSAFGVVNTVGNVWEWVTDDIIDGSYNGRSLPPEGYITQVDGSGVATMSDKRTASRDFGDDYLWVQDTGAFGVLRGGFYGSQSDAGVFTFHANTAPTMRGTAIGFRCVL